MVSGILTMAAMALVVTSFEETNTELETVAMVLAVMFDFLQLVQTIEISCFSYRFTKNQKFKIVVSCTFSMSAHAIALAYFLSMVKDREDLSYYFMIPGSTIFPMWNFLLWLTLIIYAPVLMEEALPINPYQQYTNF